MPGISSSKSLHKKAYKEKALDKIYYNGEIFKNKLNKLIKTYNLENFYCDGHPSRTVLTIKSNKIFKFPLITKTFIQQELLRNGVLWSGYHCITYTFNRSDIKHALLAYEKTFKKIIDIKNKNQNLKKFIKGSLLKKVFTRVADFQAASLKTNNK